MDYKESLSYLNYESWLDSEEKTGRKLVSRPVYERKEKSIRSGFGRLHREPSHLQIVLLLLRLPSHSR